MVIFGYFFIIILVFVVVILLLFLYYLDNDSGATNMKDNKRIDLTDWSRIYFYGQ